MTRTHRRYTDEERATSCALLEAQGYPKIKGALAKVAKSVNIPRNTLRGWFLEVNNPPPSKLRHEKRGDLATKFEDIAYAMLDQAGTSDAIDKLDGKAAVTAAAIATDKMRLLRGLPTEIVAILPTFIQAVEKMGHSPYEVMSRMIERSNHVEH